MRKILAALVIFFVPYIATAATVISSLPYSCTVSGNYELSGDLTSSTYGIYVNAVNVSIDLKGHTITWGTDGGNSTHGIYTGYVKDNLHVYSSVPGGALVHGTDAYPTGCSGIYIEEPAINPTVHDISITVKSRAGELSAQQSSGILAKRLRNGEFYNLSITNDAASVANRHSIPASGLSIEADATVLTTSLDVYNCTVSTRHVGIRVYGAASGPVNIYGNTVNVDQVAVNAYAIGAGGPGGATNKMTGGLNIYENTITTSGNGGRGVIVAHVDNFDIYGNSIVVGEAPTAESVWTNGIRVRYGARYGKVRDNYVKILCGQSGYSGGNGLRFTAQSGIDASNPLDVDNMVYNNTIVVDNQSDDYRGEAITFGNMEAGHGWVVANNTIDTNHYAVVVLPDAGPSYTAAELLIQNTSITKRTPAAGNTFYSYALMDAHGTSVIDLTSKCATYAGGATESDVFQSPSGDLTLTFADCLDNPVDPTDPDPEDPTDPTPAPATSGPILRTGSSLLRVGNGVLRVQ